MITAKQAATDLRNVTGKLIDAGILLAASQDIIQQEAGRLSKMGNAVDWDVEVPVDRALRFEPTVDKNGSEVRIFLSAKKIRVNQSDEATSPFEALDAAIVVRNTANEIVARWHIDRANVGEEPQPGPLFHLQYGGHHPGDENPDHVLNVPRWCHPPLEIALLCEVIAANFYHEKWDERLRRDPAWCMAINTFQRLSFQYYIEKLQSCCLDRTSTALGAMGADVWR